MRTVFVLLGLALSSLSSARSALAAPAPAQEPDRRGVYAPTILASEPTAGLTRLSWLAGCWRGDEGDTTVEEQWMEPRAGMMLGIGRTVRAGRVVQYEMLRIEEREGKLVYVARPSGQPEASFTQAELTDQMVRFSNPEHDFPQGIRYERRSDGSLLARIEGTIAGKPRHEDYPMERVRCPGP